MEKKGMKVGEEGDVGRLEKKGMKVGEEGDKGWRRRGCR